LNRLAEPLAASIGRIDNDWAPLLKAWRDSPAGHQLIERVDDRLAVGATVYPADVFRALRLTPLARVRVLILGQDPYHGAGQADGLAFSVPPGQRVPPSLRNIFTELQRDLRAQTPGSGSLQAWADNGVLLLNSHLSVEDGLPASHSGFGWEVLTDKIANAVAQDRKPKVFMLWGAHAQRKAGLIDATRHQVLLSNHPSPLSARRGLSPFIGCGHFARASAFLAAADTAASVLDWRLPAQAPAAGKGRENVAKVV
jgi:uracil-DNA glycosylase